jgi:uncharacterized membrane protein (UPF0136 family)
MLSMKSRSVWRTAIILALLILVGGIALFFQCFTSVISILFSVPAMLILAAYFFQSRKRERWLWSGILSAVFIREAVKDFIRPDGGYRWMFWVDVCLCIISIIFAVEEGMRQVARSSALKNDEERREAVPRSSRSLR